MSKILDLLNHTRKREDAKKGGFPEHLESENFASNIKDKLASTYIFNPADPEENIIKQQNKRILPAKHGVEPSGVRPAHLFPWLISFLAVLLLLLNIAYRGKINIKIEILGEGAVQPAPDTSGDITNDKSENPAPVYFSLVDNGRLNSNIVGRIGFYGAAQGRSRLLQDGIYLFNDGTAGWASVGMDLTEPMDLSNATFDFFIKGANGNESLEVILRDAENTSYMPQASTSVHDKNMGTDWQFISVPFRDFTGTFDVKKIKHIGFEFGTQTTSNKPMASIFVKKMKIIENNASVR